MADFLTSMTQRTLGLLPVVQPIIASKYVSEAMGAAGALTLLDPFPDQMVEEPSEYRGGPAKQLLPAALPQPLVSHANPVPPPAVPGVSPALAPPQEQPSTAPAQQIVSTPVRPQAASASRETTGGNLPSPLVPQPQTSPVRSESQPLVSRPPLDNRSPARKDMPPIASSSPEVASSQLQTSDSQENPPFSTTPTTPSVPTTKPRRGQGKPSAHSHQSTASMPLVPAPSGAIPGIAQLPQADARTAPYKNKKSGELQPISPSPMSAENGFESTSPTLVPSSMQQPFKLVTQQGFESASSIPASTGSNPPISRRNIARAKPEGMGTTPVPEKGQPEPEAGRGQPYPLQFTKRNTIDPHRAGETEPEQPGRGQAPPLPYTKHNTADPSRVRAGLAPALVPPALPSRTSAPALVAPTLRPEAPQGKTLLYRASAPALVAPIQRTDSNQLEPLLSPAYTPIQSRRTATSTAGKRAEAQLSETPAAHTIRVTIGRIDVRAVTPAPPAAPSPVRTKRALPALSLEDYLKQRNGRKL
jgi:hypothetical protein